MLDQLGEWKRTQFCGELRAEDVGKEVIIMGWVASYRDHGGVIFVDLRDRTGIVQVVFNPEVCKDAHKKAGSLRNEWVLAVKGKVRLRPEGTVNPNLATGEIEVLADELKILNRSEPTPFAIEDGIKVTEELRLKYRYLDLRIPQTQKRFFIRHKVAKLVRDYFFEQGFIEVETPFLTKSTPEGARDYLVPSRVYPGKFFALPQSPQLFKQILMVAGFDKYFQIVRCMRDEDLRADRQPEFTQIDVEMSFIDEEDIFRVIEGMLFVVFKEILGIELSLPFQRMSWEMAMENYGIDKPDTRFELLLKNLTDIFLHSEYRFFKEAVGKGGIIKGLNVPGCASWSRKETDDLTHALKAYGAKGLTVIRYQDEGLTGPAVKYLTDEEKAKMIERLSSKHGDLLLIMADDFKTTNEAMAQLRLMIAKKLNLIKEGMFNFLWVVDFPLFEWSELEKRWKSMHHPFTSPKFEDLDLIEKDPAKLKAKAYDIVLNGVELGGGSIRIHQPEIQQRVFKVLGISDEEARMKFGFLLDALKYGAPPHGGIALGFDRMIQLITGGTSIRDVIAFPKTQTASDLMCDAPSDVSPAQLKELSLKLDLK